MEGGMDKDFHELLDFGKRGDYRPLDLPRPRPAAEGLVLEPGSLEALARHAFETIAFFLPSCQLEGFAAVLADPAASEAERFVAASLIRNAVIAAEGIYPLCQDTGVALVYAWKGEGLKTGGRDETEFESGARSSWKTRRLRASIQRPLSFLDEANSGDNLPIHADIRAVPGSSYRLLFASKGGGSANRTSLSMESPALLEKGALETRLQALVQGLGVSGCPPYRVSCVLGGLSPDEGLYALALAGLGLLDALPSTGPGALRDRVWEGIIDEAAKATGLGAQFGGRHLALDTRAIRLPRHAASLPLAFGVSCAAQRKARALIDEEGFFIERLEEDPARFLPKEEPVLPGAVRIELDRPQRALAAELGALEPGSALLLSGRVIAARDKAHARWRAILAEGGTLPPYLLEHPVFYAGPTEAAPGLDSGSFGPTTAGRMDSFLEALLSRGASLVSIAKGGRSRAAAKVLAARGGVYLCAIGGAAALTGREHVVSSRVIDLADLGMEAVRVVELRDLPVVLGLNARGDLYGQTERGG
jgi:fumarate hydratase class I